MRIFLDVVGLRKGGAVQGATSFIREAIQDDSGHRWCFAVSSVLRDQMDRFDVKTEDRIEVFDRAPVRCRPSRRRLRQLEAEFAPDCVLTPSGPAYVEFRAPHMLGIQLPWFTHATWSTYRMALPFYLWPRSIPLSLYRIFWFRRADAWVTQTETSRQGFSRRVGVPAEKVAVVSNTCGQAYFENQAERPFPASTAKVRLLCFAAPYRHKRLELIPHVVARLAELRPQLDFEFVITLPAHDKTLACVMRIAERLGVAGRIHNAGLIAVADGPALYRDCDVCFLPTVLETFTATYPESMAMGLPIVTSRLGFATDVCRDAALYFQPNDAADAAAKLDQLLGDEALWKRLVVRGKTVLQSLPTPRDRYRLLVESLQNMVDGRPVYQSPAG